MFHLFNLDWLKYSRVNFHCKFKCVNILGILELYIHQDRG